MRRMRWDSMIIGAHCINSFLRLRPPERERDREKKKDSKMVVDSNSVEESSTLKDIGTWSTAHSAQHHRHRHDHQHGSPASKIRDLGIQRSVSE